MTAGSQTNGGYVIQTFRWSSPKYRNRGVDRMAIVTTLTSSARPIRFQIAMSRRPPRPCATSHATTNAEIPVMMSKLRPE